MMNQTARYQFTILIPVYNEEDNIGSLAQCLGTFLPRCSFPACVLFINDGSTDTSLARIREVCQRGKDFFYLSLRNNAGLSTALKAGIDAVESAYVGYMDADLQTDPADFNLLLPYLVDYKLVTGIRADRKDSSFKKMQSRIANRFRRAFTHDGIEDTGCPLKVMHTDCAKRIPFFTGMHRFLPALVLLQKGNVKQVPVRHYPRMAGQSKYHLWNRLASPLADCMAYRWMKKRYIRYQIESQNVQSGEHHTIIRG